MCTASFILFAVEENIATHKNTATRMMTRCCIFFGFWNAQNEFLSSNEVFVAMLPLYKILALFCLKEIGYEYESRSSEKLCCLFQRFFFWRKKEVTGKCCHSHSEDNFDVPPASW